MSTPPPLAPETLCNSLAAVSHNVVLFPAIHFSVFLRLTEMAIWLVRRCPPHGIGPIPFFGVNAQCFTAVAVIAAVAAATAAAVAAVVLCSFCAEQLPLTFTVLIFAYFLSGLGSTVCEYLLYGLSYLGVGMSVAMHRFVRFPAFLSACLAGNWRVDCDCWTELSRLLRLLLLSSR